MSFFRRRLLYALKKHSYKEGDFTLASGKKSSYYINCKSTLLNTEQLMNAAKLMNEAALRYNAYILAGSGVGGIPLVVAGSLLADCEEGLDFMIVRKVKKDHGTENRVETGFDFPKGARVALYEDVVTTGGSVISAAEAVRGAGFEPVVVVSVVDRLEGGRENIEKAGLVFKSILTINDFREIM